MMRGRNAEAAKAAADVGKLWGLPLGWGSRAALKMACTHTLHEEHLNRLPLTKHSSLFLLHCSCASCPAQSCKHEHKY